MAPAINPWVIALTVTLATFMEVLDTSIANVALPHIAGSLPRAGREYMGAHVVSGLERHRAPAERLAVFHHGRKRFYMSCVALFTVSSCLCGFAPNLSMLIVFRILQGVAAAACSRANKRSLPIPLLPPNAAWRLPSTALRW